MQQEEAKFKSKYGNLKPCGGSALLTKRLQKVHVQGIPHSCNVAGLNPDYNYQ